MINASFFVIFRYKLSLFPDLSRHCGQRWMLFQLHLRFEVVLEQQPPASEGQNQERRVGRGQHFLLRVCFCVCVCVSDVLDRPRMAVSYDLRTKMSDF